MTMQTKTTLIAASMGLFLLPSCSSIKPPPGPASATLKIEGFRGGYHAVAAGGDGVLSYQGRQVPFTITSAGAGGSGGMSISATGQVYNMTSLADFPGTYSSTRKGITIGKGKFTALLKSDRGVQIYLDGETTGVGTSGGVSAVDIKLK